MKCSSSHLGPGDTMILQGSVSDPNLPLKKTLDLAHYSQIQTLTPILYSQIITPQQNQQNLLHLPSKQTSMVDSDHQSLVVSNDDLLTSILLCLPVTSILRFKSVSKHWYGLLTHPHFTYTYDNNHSKTPGLFGKDTYIPFNNLENNKSPLGSQTLAFYFNLDDVRIVHACNGLLLCCSNVDFNYYVFNPTTKQLITIPPVIGGYDYYDYDHKRFVMSLAFHRTECGHFKIVCVCGLEAKMMVQVQVYSSDTGKWKISVESFHRNRYVFSNGVYCNGAIHWPPSHGGHLWFDIEAEEMRTLPSPVELEMISLGKLYFETYFGESRGHLHIIEAELLSDHDFSLCLNVYEMLRDRSGWFVKYRVDLDDVWRAYPRMMFLMVDNFSIIDVVRGEEEEDTFMVMKINKEHIITYNVHDKSFKHIHDITGHHHSSFHRYTEALTYF